MESALRLRYQTIEFGHIDIHLCTLRDRQEYSDPHKRALKLGIPEAFWSLFGVVWPSSMVLANFMLDYETAGKRILEVGCGIALTSLLLNKQHADITATDNHPDVAQFLARNTQLNNDTPIHFERTDWIDKNDSLARFDIIVGSDLLYEDQHVEQLAHFMNNHAKPHCDIILVDPGRGRKNKLTRLMTTLGYTNDHSKPENTDAYLIDSFKGHILQFSR